MILRPATSTFGTDELPPGDPRAAGSRRDLRRLNTWMRNHAIMANALQTAATGQTPKRIVELGAGDGDFLLRVARRLSSFGVPSRPSRDGSIARHLAA